MRDGAQEVKEMARTFCITFVAIFMVLATLTSAFAAVDDVQLKEAKLSVAQNTVSGQFKLYNPAGSGDMVRTSLLEMSIRKPGGAFLAIFGAQEMCDPTHPENVNRQYLLEDGETFTLSVAAPPLPDGLYEVWCETANACYAPDPQSFRSEGPCAGGLRLASLDLRATSNVPVLQPEQPEVGTGGVENEITVQPGDAVERAVILWKAIGTAVIILAFGGILLWAGMVVPGFLVLIAGALLLLFGLFGGG